MTLRQTRYGSKAANDAFQKWKHIDDKCVRHSLEQVAKDIAEEKNDIAKIITLEQGKPLQLALLEVDLALYWIETIKNYEIPVDHIEDPMGKKMEVHNKPLGVVASITPWNWPFVIAIWHIIPALKTKNCIINKPSEFTPLSTIKLVEIINRHFPSGVCNLILGKGEVGRALTEHPQVQKITFTGSTKTGISILNGTVGQFKKVVLELGGNDAAIILDDVNIESVAEKVFQSAFFNAGQTCACIKRLYIHEKVYDPFVSKLSELADKQKVGDGMESQTTFGPVQNEIQYLKVKNILKKAITNGAKVLNNPQKISDSGYFIFPTLVGEVNENMEILTEEQFGPILPIVKYSDVGEVIKDINRSEYGLGGSVWSSNIDKAKTIADQLECGTVWINSHADVSPLAEFGGWKTSGIGYAFGKSGLLAYTKKQAIHISN
ncbi:aldehyde dehydrogenase family protein [Acinetobacter baumannii]|uniref:aldehyde dehydrogenase family protein n=1 Tax=Acinetobacter baumannii TaxID=470 RepID=UPI00349F73D9